MKRYLLLFALLLFLTVGCSSMEKNEGVIIDKRPSNENTQLLVVPGVSEDDFKNKTERELIELAKENEGAYYYVTNEEHENLEVGTKVSIQWNGTEAESNPPQRTAQRLEVQEE
ncbi:DUF3221 domain-containing protein [Halobacillus locisalis]|uniref:DUF3221 domain-containing protein n=1 Tax=Halobacillus locisalis TaxID=220753 RepID=A0A838CWG7_9BACI|nr:DUF3221 domain-containing protein [Halobacillus locisalis]MBA2176278.1 DUF3221 domain-containing protein [Halobacillus locisalis]